MKLKKRGVVETGAVLIELLLGAVVLLLLFGIFYLLVINPFGDFSEQSSLTSFDNLVNNTKNLEKSLEPIKIIENFPISLHEDATIIGFNKDQDVIKDACGKKEEIEKPKAKCGNSACLCYYNPGYYDEFKENSKLGDFAHSCVQIPNVDYIISFYYAESIINENAVKSHYGVFPEVYENILGDKISLNFPPYYPKEQYSYLAIYGECDDSYWDSQFGRHNMYMEKVKDPATGKIYLLIAAQSDKNYIKSRKEMLEKNIKKSQSEYLTLLASSFDKGDYEKAREYAQSSLYYYPNDIKVENYLTQITQKEKEKEQAIKKALADAQEAVNPPGFPPGLTPTTS